MLIGFVGSPCSGKTTAAFSLSSALKNNGKPVEFFPEYAREYIMKKRYMMHNITLGRSDQFAIYTGQKEREMMYKLMSPNSITITDGSTLNSYFYGLQGDLKLEDELDRYDVIFFCRGLKNSEQDDNRVHDQDFSKMMDKKIAERINNYINFVAEDYKKICVLWGNKEERLKTALEFLDEIS
jgi:hypothetical protein